MIKNELPTDPSTKEKKTPTFKKFKEETLHFQVSEEELIRSAVNNDAAELAAIYIEVYKEWDEEHDAVEMEKKFRQWIEDFNYNVNVYLKNDKPIGFAVTRIESEKVIKTMFREMEGVSGLTIEKEKKKQVEQNIKDLIVNTELSTKDLDKLSAGVIQDIGILEEHRGIGSSYMVLMILALEELLNECSDLIITYVKKDSPTAKSVENFFPAIRAYEKNSTLLLAALTEKIKREWPTFRKRFNRIMKRQQRK